MKSVLYELTPCELQILLDSSDGYSDVLRKLDLNPKGGNPETLKKIIKEYELDTTQLQINRTNLYRKCANNTHRKRSIPLEDILNNKIQKPYSSAKLLKRLIKAGYKQYCCEQCGIKEWNNKPIVLQLEHKDGDHNNNTIDNLQILCPNCHSQTATFNAVRKWCVKYNLPKKVSVIKTISDEEWENI